MLRLVMYYFQVNEYFTEMFEKCKLRFPDTSSSFVSSNIYWVFIIYVQKTKMLTPQNIH